MRKKNENNNYNHAIMFSNETKITFFNFYLIYRHFLKKVFLNINPLTYF